MNTLIIRGNVLFVLLYRNKVFFKYSKDYVALVSITAASLLVPYLGRQVTAIRLKSRYMYISSTGARSSNELHTHLHGSVAGYNSPGKWLGDLPHLKLACSKTLSIAVNITDFATAWSILWLQIKWRRRELGHQQPWYWNLMSDAPEFRLLAYRVLGNIPAVPQCVDVSMLQLMVRKLGHHWFR